MLATPLSAVDQFWDTMMKHDKRSAWDFEKICIFTIFILYVLLFVVISFTAVKIRPSICYSLPDETNFLEIGGVSPRKPPPPPGEFQPC